MLVWRPGLGIRSKGALLLVIPLLLEMSVSLMVSVARRQIYRGSPAFQRFAPGMILATRRSCQLSSRILA
jgi:hypothetical protein